MGVGILADRSWRSAVSCRVPVGRAWTSLVAEGKLPRELSRIAQPPPGGLAGRVLVVDDMDMNGRLVRAVLARDGHEVAVVESGEAALAAISSVAPDVILLDVM